METQKNLSVAIALTIGIFMIDLLTPVGYADYLLYLIPLLVVAPVLRSLYILYFPTVSTLLIGLGFFLSPSGGDLKMAVINRIMGILVLWAASFIIIKRNQAQKSLDHSFKDLEAANRKLHKEIAERELTEKALRESSEKYRIIIETANEGICIADDKYSIIFVNRKMADMIGYSEKELQGNKLTDLVFPEDINVFLDHMELRKKGVAEQYEYRLRRKNGSACWISISATPLVDDHRQFKGSFAMLTDITSRKEAEMELTRMYAKLEERVRQRTAELEHAYREMESFSCAVSHDLKAPIVRIKGFSEILSTDYTDKLNDEAKDVLKRISDNTSKMIALIESILNYSRLGAQPVNKTATDMAALAQKAYEEVRSVEGERDIRFKINNMPLAYCDQVLMSQVFLNLLANAMKFTRERKAAVIAAGGASRGYENIYYVSDNGIGFDMKFNEKLFGLFQRIHAGKEFEGTGVGLVIVKKIIQKHGGRVWAEGKPDEGATFYFSLPTKPG